MANLPKYTLEKDEEGDRWVLQHDKTWNYRRIDRWS
jgi:hypothetical protein